MVRGSGEWVALAMITVEFAMRVKMDGD